MRAWLLREPNAIAKDPLSMVKLPRPDPGAGQVRVKVSACGLCRTDLHLVEGDVKAALLPVVPGHQIVGRVDAVGPGVGRWKVGERLGIAWLRHTCGACEWCHRGMENLCAASRYTGSHHHGGFAEWAVVHEDFAYALPPAFSDRQAAPLLCAGIIGYRALRQCGARPGELLGIYGFGSSAHITTQVARHRGIEVAVVTRAERNRSLARQLGAVWVGGVEDSPPEPFHCVVIFAPRGDLVPRALEALRPGGTVACAGIFMSPVPSLDYVRHLFEEKKLTSVTSNTREDGRELLAIAAEI
ncbi:MAG: zinc-dependent alcohol dehydrogenase family protein, partial [Planctomycetota bacterium]